MRIGVANELVVETEVLLRALALKPEHRILWVARSTREAVESCAVEPPDLVLMALHANRRDSVEATRRIMTSTPCAILIVPASVQANAADVFDAMAYGAIDAVDMPAGVGNLQQNAAPLLAKCAIIARLIAEREPVARAPVVPGPAARLAFRHPLIAIGSSAGGPAALATVLRALPKGFPAAVVVVQHLDEQFSDGMADWLSRQSGVPVTVAMEGEYPAVGRVLLAGTNRHLVLTSADRFGYSPEPAHAIYRPSIDVLFESVSRMWAGRAIGVILTGMGSDGAAGLRLLRDRGHYTITQDQASSAVYGMPKAAAALNAAVDILPVERIGSRLMEVVAGPSLVASDRHGRAGHL